MCGVFLLTLAAKSIPAQTTTDGIGGQIFSIGGNVVVTILPSDAAFTSNIYVLLNGNSQFLGTNHQPGNTVDLGPVPAGTELEFSIQVTNTGNQFYTGPGARNPDGAAHAVVATTAGPSGPTSVVGFEDLTSKEGADFDYNDALIQVAQRRVMITKADVTTDEIEVTLNPPTDSGNLSVRLSGTFGGATGEMILFNDVKTGGSYTFSFNPTGLPIGHYDQVRVTWTVNGTGYSDSKDIAFFVLGKYRHSQYNTPSEETCGGEPAPAFITDGACNFMKTMLLSRFIQQVNLNGSGRSTEFGDVVREAVCTQKQKKNKPPPGAKQHSFRQKAIVPSCAGMPLDDTTVARMPDHPNLECGDQVLIVGLGGGAGQVKTVTDLCPGCPETQLDNYTTDPACSKIRDLGRFVTIRLH